MGNLVNMEIAKLQIIAHVRLAGKDQFVISAYPYQVVNMETVQMLWNVIVKMDGQEDFAKFHTVAIVKMESAKVLKNACASLDGKVMLVTDVSHSLVVQMEIV